MISAGFPTILRTENSAHTESMHAGVGKVRPNYRRKIIISRPNGPPSNPEDRAQAKLDDLVDKEEERGRQGRHDEDHDRGQHHRGGSLVGPAHFRADLLDELTGLVGHVRLALPQLPAPDTPHGQRIQARHEGAAFRRQNVWQAPARHGAPRRRGLAIDRCLRHPGLREPVFDGPREAALRREKLMTRDISTPASPRATSRTRSRSAHGAVPTMLAKAEEALLRSRARSQRRGGHRRSGLFRGRPTPGLAAGAVVPQAATPPRSMPTTAFQRTRNQGEHPLPQGGRPVRGRGHPPWRNVCWRSGGHDRAGYPGDLLQPLARRPDRRFWLSMQPRAPAQPTGSPTGLSALPPGR